MNHGSLRHKRGISSWDTPPGLSPETIFHYTSLDWQTDVMFIPWRRDFLLLVNARCNVIYSVWASTPLPHVSENPGSVLNIKFSFSIHLVISLWDIETPRIARKARRPVINTSPIKQAFLQLNPRAKLCETVWVQLRPIYESRESVRCSPAGSRTNLLNRNALKQCPWSSYTTSGMSAQPCMGLKPVAIIGLEPPQSSVTDAVF